MKELNTVQIEKVAGGAQVNDSDVIEIIGVQPNVTFGMGSCRIVGFGVYKLPARAILGY